jgi:beta-glucanase (GH16 family)
LLHPKKQILDTILIFMYRKKTISRIMKNCYHVITLLLFCFTFSTAQIDVFDDFEGNGTITTWTGDDCNININENNPFQDVINSSNTVLGYNDIGGQYANVRFEVSDNFDMTEKYFFSLKVYVPSSGLSGGQSNQVSLKLQDGTLAEPWVSQSEIIKQIVLDQWQTITFDFKNDNFINLDANSLPPAQRSDFNRVVIQLNGENNEDLVIAYIDDVLNTISDFEEPVFDNLVWSDEFENDGPIDSDKWFHQTQLPQGGSWFNGEIQHYTNQLGNSYVEDGMLKLVAKKESFTDQGITKQYTSARLNSKYAFTYGRIEIRAKLPTGVGTWPAIWMLGQNINEDGGFWDIQGFGNSSWPACGEIDIMEHWGDNQNYVQSAMHTPSSFGNTMNLGGQFISTASSGFHVYALEWTAGRMVFSVDDEIHYTYNPSVKDQNTWPYDAPQYLLLNIAIQPFIIPSFTESAMEIDYVRVYEESPLAIVENSQNSNLIIYPNPVDNILTIDLPNESNQEVDIIIYSIQGDVIKTDKLSISDYKLFVNNLDMLSSGLYIIHFEIDDEEYNLKFIKR